MIAFKGRCHKDLMHIAPDIKSCSQRLIVNDKLEILRNLSARILLCQKQFEYWIGIFSPENTTVPQGFGYVDFPKSELGVCWVYGKDGEVYGKEGVCSAKLGEEGYKIISDEKGAWWFFERYVCPRFTTPDDKGNIILDVCHYIE